MSNLSQSKCVACRSGDARLTDQEITLLLPDVPEWRILEMDEIKRLQRIIKVKNFVAALELANRIGVMAEAEDHHPLLVIEWGRLTVQWWTHVVRGLHKNDFIMAAKTDRLLE